MGWPLVIVSVSIGEWSGYTWEGYVHSIGYWSFPLHTSCKEILRSLFLLGMVISSDGIAIMLLPFPLAFVTHTELSVTVYFRFHLWIVPFYHIAKNPRIDWHCVRVLPTVRLRGESRPSFRQFPTLYRYHSLFVSLEEESHYDTRIALLGRKASRRFPEISRS